jgi:hypothetical protein
MNVLTGTGEFLLKFDFGLKLLWRELGSCIEREEPHDRKRERPVSKPTPKTVTPPSKLFFWKVYRQSITQHE